MPSHETAAELLKGAEIPSDQPEVQDDENRFAQQMRDSRLALPDGTRIKVALPIIPKAKPTAPPPPLPDTSPLGLSAQRAVPRWDSQSPLSDKPLCLHHYHPRVELLSRPPLVMLTPEVYKRISLFIHVAKREVGWMGTVSQTEQGDYLIDQVFLLHQDVSDVETEMSEEGQAQLGLELDRKYGVGAIAHANRMHFWGHSHVRMQTGPSERDENTSLRFGKTDGFKLLVRGIFNKRGRAAFDVYLFDKGVRVLDVPWGIFDPANKTIIYLREAETPGISILAPPAAVAPLTLGAVVKEGAQKAGAKAADEVRQSVDAFTSMFDKELSLEVKFAGLPEFLRPTEEELAAVMAEYKLKVTEHVMPGFTQVRKLWRALKGKTKP